MRPICLVQMLEVLVCLVVSLFILFVQSASAQTNSDLELRRIQGRWQYEFVEYFGNQHLVEESEPHCIKIEGTVVTDMNGNQVQLVHRDGDLGVGWYLDGLRIERLENIYMKIVGKNASATLSFVGSIPPRQVERRSTDFPPSILFVALMLLILAVVLGRGTGTFPSGSSSTGSSSTGSSGSTGSSSSPSQPPEYGVGVPKGNIG